MTDPTVELHFHALPGLDDGPSTLEESVVLLRQARIDGTVSVVATPHVRGDFVTDVHDFGDRVAELRAAARRHAVDVRVEVGAELGHDMVGRLGQRELESLAQGPPGARWLLVEAPFTGMDESFHLATEELRDRGFGVLVAHPERSADVQADGAGGLRRELAAGSLAQVNAGSITGLHGEGAREAVMGLIREGLASVLSSDAHGPTRPPLLAAAGDCLLEAGLGRGVRDALILRGPRRLLVRGIRAPLVAA